MSISHHTAGLLFYFIFFFSHNATNFIDFVTSRIRVLYLTFKMNEWWDNATVRKSQWIHFINTIRDHRLVATWTNSLHRFAYFPVSILSESHVEGRKRGKHWRWINIEFCVFVRKYRCQYCRVWPTDIANGTRSFLHTFEIMLCVGRTGPALAWARISPSSHWAEYGCIFLIILYGTQGLSWYCFLN